MTANHIHRTVSDSTPLVSVVLPVYNAAPYVETAVASILQQTHRQLEIILLNDGSTDGSDQILQALQSRDARIRLVETQNRGLVATLNEGMKLATGTYIARMDADDIAAPRRIEKQVAFLQDHPDVGVCGSWTESFGDGLGINRFPATHAAICVTALFKTPMAHPAVTMRRQTLFDHDLFYAPEFAYCEDYELWTRCMDHTRLANLPEVLLRYRVHRQQWSEMHLRKFKEYHLRVMQRMFSRLELNPDPHQLNLLLGRETAADGMHQAMALCEDMLGHNKDLDIYDQGELAQAITDRIQYLIVHFYGIAGWLAYAPKSLRLPLGIIPKVLRRTLVNQLKPLLKKPGAG